MQKIWNNKVSRVTWNQLTEDPKGGNEKRSVLRKHGQFIRDIRNFLAGIWPARRQTMIQFTEIRFARKKRIPCGAINI